MSRPIRLVLLSDGSRFGLQLMRALRARHVPIVEVAIEDRRSASMPWRRRWHEWVRLAFVRTRYLTAGTLVRLVGARNSSQMIAALRSLQPDLLVLGGMGVLSPAVLGIARLGVINGHPALLPWVRGAGVVIGSMLRGVPAGASVHLVDQGVDTGAVLARRLVRADQAGLGALERAADAMAIELLAQVVEQIATARGLPPSTLLHSGLPTLRAKEMAAFRDEAERRVKAGDAGRLYRAAMEAIGGEDLPPGHWWSPLPR